ncbi:MAG: C25 family cysteine peptidase [Anaerolineae bacterium]|nr:C25 family cysteine peptidase [Anaerolineae bacterium]
MHRLKVTIAAGVGFILLVSQPILLRSAYAQVSGMQATASTDALRVEVAFDRPEQTLALPLRWPIGEDRLLPYAAWLVALPAGADTGALDLEIEQLELDRAEKDALVLPERSPEIAALPLPEGKPVHIEPAGVMRGVSLARVLFFPLRPSAEGWEWVRRARLKVRLPQSTTLQPQQSIQDPLLRQVATQVVNPQEVAEAVPSGASAPAAFAASVLALIDVERPALIELTRAQLHAAGVAVGSPHRLRLRQGGQEVRMIWEGDADDVFEPDERLLFYAQPRFSRYSAYDTWILEDAGVPVERVNTRSAAPSATPTGVLHSTFMFEQNALYTPDCGCHPPAHRDGDRWAWVNLQRTQRWTHSFTLPVITAQPASLTVWLLGYTDPIQDPDHYVQVWLNGALLGESLWNGRLAITATFAGMVSANNVLSITLPGLPGVTVEGMWVDGFAVTTATSGQGALGLPLRGEAAARTYALSVVPLYLLDVTTPTHPVLLRDWEHTAAGARFADPPSDLPRTYVAFTQTSAPTRIRLPEALNPAQGNLHVIAPMELQPALVPLLARRQAQGFAVVTQTIQALYDHHGDGRVDPLAIRAYFAHRYHHDTIRPTYALLVGDGTLDPKRYRATSPPTLIPTLLESVDPLLGETATDNRFVTVDGSDALPDIALGRLPVNTFTETQIVVSKVLDYERALLVPSLDRRFLLVADNADAAGDFPAKALNLASLAPSSYVTTAALMTSAGLFTATRETVLSHWNHARLISYLGHASPRQWAAERLLHRDDVSSLPSRDALPVVIEMTCYTARFHELQDTLDESLVRAAARGAVAAWGATGLTISTGHDQLAQGFVRSWLGGSRLGDATFAGKLALASGGIYLDLLDTFVLLGDPSLALGSRWATHSLHFPIFRRQGT